MIFLSTAQRMEVALLLVRTEYVTPFYFLAWGQGPIQNVVFCSLLFPLLFTMRQWTKSMM